MTAGNHPPRPSDVVGVRWLPPGSVSALVGRMRQSVGRLHRAMGPPPVRILEALFGLLDHGGLVAFCELGLPDVLDRPMPVPELARRLHVGEEPLGRLLSYGAARGWLRLDRRGRAAPNATTRFLRSDHPGGWRAWVDLAGGRDVVAAVGSLGPAVRTGADCFALANGSSFFEWMTAHADRARAFDAAMAAGARMHGLALAAAIDWSTSERICDVGGGDGTLIETLMTKQRHLAGVLLDLPDVVAGRRSTDRFDIVPGDAFTSVPPDCDTYLFVNVVHDWPDPDVVRLFRRVIADGPAGARVIVVEGEKRRSADDVTARTDLLMLALAPGGRERTTAEIAGLGRRAGFHHHHSVALASADNAHVLMP